MWLGGLLVPSCLALAGLANGLPFLDPNVCLALAGAGFVIFLMGLLLYLTGKREKSVDVHAEQGTAGRDQYQALQGDITVGDRIIRHEHREPVIRIKEDGVMLTQRDKLFAVFPRVKVANPDAFHRATVRIRLSQQDVYGGATVARTHSPTADALAALRRAYKDAEPLPEVVGVEREGYREGAAIFLLPRDFAAEAEESFGFRLIDDLTDMEIRAAGSGDGGIARRTAAKLESES